jgi:multimeric flavodoxin WrbA
VSPAGNGTSSILDAKGGTLLLKALFLNATLKKSPETSNTQALIDVVADLMKPMEVECETVRLVDHRISPGTSSDMGDGDEWPAIYEKMKAADILIPSMPIWMGSRSSPCQAMCERLDGSYEDIDPKTGQYPLYGKVAGVIVTGNEDGAHLCAATTLFNFTHYGCVVPPNVDCYWVGEAGPGPSYIKAGQGHLYTNRTARFLASSVVWMATLLKEHGPNPTNLLELTEDAKKVSTDTAGVG